MGFLDLFRAKNPINSAEYEDLAKKLVALSTEIKLFDNKLAILETANRSLRMTVNKHISGEKDVEEEAKNIKTSESTLFL